MAASRFASACSSRGTLQDLVSRGVETHYEYSTGVGSWHGCVRNPLFIAAAASVAAFSARSGLGGGGG